MSVRGAWLHVVADTLGSIGAISAAALIWLFGWHWADPVASIAICVLILYSAWTLVKQTLAVLMEAVPRSVDLDAVHAALTSVAGVTRVHDLHVWALTSGRNVVSAHVTLQDGTDRRRVMLDARTRLRDLDLHHSTLQLDCDGDHCEPCDA
jgi:cobalt-zinc-cadmium efflux system protein